MRRFAAIIVVASLLVLALGPASGAAPRRRGADAVLVAHVAGRRFVRTSTFSTPAGYRYQMTLQLEEGPPRAGDSSSLPPRWFAINVPVRGSLSVKNLTPGRLAPNPLPVQNIALVGLWRSPSPVCEIGRDPMNTPGSPDAYHEQIGSTEYCRAIQYFPVSVGSPADIGIGKTFSEKLATSSYGCSGNWPYGSARSCPSTLPAHTDVFVASRATDKGALAVLDTPDVVLLYLSLGNFEKGTDVCTDGGSDQPGYGGFAWVIAHRVPLPTRACPNRPPSY